MAWASGNAQVLFNFDRKSDGEAAVEGAIDTNVEQLPSGWHYSCEALTRTLVDLVFVPVLAALWKLRHGFLHVNGEGIRTAYLESRASQGGNGNVRAKPDYVWNADHCELHHEEKPRRRALFVEVKKYGTIHPDPDNTNYPYQLQQARINMWTGCLRQSKAEHIHDPDQWQYGLLTDGNHWIFLRVASPYHKMEVYAPVRPLTPGQAGVVIYRIFKDAIISRTWDPRTNRAVGATPLGEGEDDHNTINVVEDVEVVERRAGPHTRSQQQRLMATAPAEIPQSSCYDATISRWLRDDGDIMGTHVEEERDTPPSPFEHAKSGPMPTKRLPLGDVTNRQPAV